MKEPKMKPSDLQAEAQRLLDSGRMPSLADVLAAVNEAREKYQERILAARKLTAEPSQPHARNRKENDTQ